MPKDSRLTDPNDYLSQTQKFFSRNLRSQVPSVYAFAPDADSGEPPFTLGRLTTKDLTDKLVTKKLSNNPRLNFIGSSPEEYEMFAGLGRFDRETYDFDTGKPLIPNRFTQDPVYAETVAKWNELYEISPVVENKVKTKMPSASNPDPRQIVQNEVNAIVDSEVSGDETIASLIKGGSDKDKDKEEA